MCRKCGNTGKYGDKGYWVYCSCEKGEELKKGDEK